MVAIREKESSSGWRESVRELRVTYTVDKDPRATNNSPKDGANKAAVGFESAVSGPLEAVGATQTQIQ